MTYQRIGISGYIGLYEIDTNGHVWALEKQVKHWRGGISIRKERKLASVLNAKGYIYYKLTKNGNERMISAQQLVAQAFIKGFTKELEVNHINGIRHDSRLVNLEMLSHEQNIKHAIFTGLLTYKLTLKQVKEIRRLYKTGRYYQRELASMYNVTRTLISRIVNNKRWGWTEIKSGNTWKECK